MNREQSAGSKRRALWGHLWSPPSRGPDLLREPRPHDGKVQPYRRLGFSGKQGDPRWKRIIIRAEEPCSQEHVEAERIYCILVGHASCGYLPGWWTEPLTN